MLASLNDILKIANKRGIAVGSFNTPNLESLKAVIGAAEELEQPVFIMHAQVHEEQGVCRIDEIAPIMRLFAEKAKVPVCVHLDHGTDIEFIKRGLDLGFNSVMYDGSKLSEEMNTENTKKIVELAEKYGACVEAEIGSMGKRDSGVAGSDYIYTEPDAAARFAKNTGIDALSCAFGTVHGFHAAAPKLDFERLSKINDAIGVPVVMHGGSGVSPEDYKEVIKRGVRKVNYYTYLAKAGAEAVANKPYKQFHEAVADAEKAMYEDVLNAIKIFANL